MDLKQVPEKVLEAEHALRKHDCEKALQIIRTNPQVLTYFQDKRDFVEVCTYGCAGVAKLFLDAGADPNAVSRKTELTAIERAAASGSIGVVKLLLERGAKINTNEGKCNALFQAIATGNLEMVKFIVENGGSTSYVSRTGENCLTRAIERGQHEIADYFRSLGIQIPSQYSQTPQSTSISDHMSLIFGPVEPTEVRQVLPLGANFAIRLARGVDKDVLFTDGLWEHEFVMPKEFPTYRRGEIIAFIPSEGEFDDQSIQRDPLAWILSWMGKIGQMALESCTWCRGTYNLYANGDPPQPLDSSVAFTSLAIMEASSPFTPAMTNGETVRFWQILPLHTSEYQFAKHHGIPGLSKATADRGFPTVITPYRPPLI